MAFIVCSRPIWGTGPMILSQKRNLLRLIRVYDQTKPFNVLHINRTVFKIKSYIAFLSRKVTIANFFILFSAKEGLHAREEEG